MYGAQASATNQTAASRDAKCLCDGDWIIIHADLVAPLQEFLLQAEPQNTSLSSLLIAVRLRWNKYVNYWLQIKTKWIQQNFVNQ